ncbi:tyrosine-type recombinase/integrase [Methanobacterium ferruginis]|uniref:tyrosine-type recombinase/integrase n=1 Tax=Methanobacterium ferruginis TaxID=710191 RepID=UPI002573BBD5|nr:site-specific integrase [Methanobacterium ferruginis]BDZ67379.1 hypothetical protein GCM10025860_08270 [Methanobacterium ferruginis]
MSRAKFTSIEDEPIFKDFCSKRELRYNTIRTYKNTLNMYCNFLNKGLEELIEEAEDEEESDMRMRKRKINHYLINFKSELDKSDLADSSIKQMMILIKAFYREFDIEVPRSRRRKSPKPTYIETIEDLPTMDEIQLFLEYCGSVYKAIVLTGLSSGMSRAELASLTFKHLYDALSLTSYPETLDEVIEKAKENDTILFWNLIRVKTDKSFFTFSSPESLDRIIMYLEELHQRHPDYNPRLEDKLFRSKRTNSNLTSNEIGSMFTYINNKNGFRKVNGRFVVRSHNLRKFFATTLEKNNIPHLATRFLLGHSIETVTNAYFKPDVESIKNHYLSVVNQLMTNKVEIKIINQYGDLQQQIEEIRHDEQKHMDVIGDLVNMVNTELTKLGNDDISNEEARIKLNEDQLELVKRFSRLDTKLKGIKFKDKITC